MDPRQTIATDEPGNRRRDRSDRPTCSWAKTSTRGWRTRSTGGRWSSSPIPNRASSRIAPAAATDWGSETRSRRRLFPPTSADTSLTSGQNMVGWIRLRIRNAPPGKTIDLRYTEMLDKDGKPVHDRPSHRARDRSLHRRAAAGRGILRAALHLPRLPLCRSPRLSRPESDRR